MQALMIIIFVELGQAWGNLTHILVGLTRLACNWAFPAMVESHARCIFRSEPHTLLFFLTIFKICLNAINSKTASIITSGINFNHIIIQLIKNKLTDKKLCR